MYKYDYVCPKCNHHKTVETVGKVLSVTCPNCNRGMKCSNQKTSSHSQTGTPIPDDFEQLTLFNMKLYDLGG